MARTAYSLCLARLRYLGGWTLAEIAAEARCCVESVRRRLLADGVQMRPPGRVARMPKARTARCVHCKRPAHDNHGCAVGGCPLGNDL